MIAILDPGVGNLQSVTKGFSRVGAETVVVDQAAVWRDLVQGSKDEIEGVVLPGVGAFGDAMFQLRAAGLIPVLRQVAREGRPLFGICLGMQLLFGSSQEHGRHMGLGLLPGEVVRFKDDMKVPHMGWNDLDVVRTHPLLRDVKVGDYVYFVHSYYVEATNRDCVLAAATYGSVSVPGVVGQGNVLGAQFHPEKSGEVGERILHNFVALCRAWQTQREAVQ
ncbi:imidazole glycerol phosphate synthase subunit HisH [Alicyclobacillus fastidiosus]|uniref:Imidazole glycerol phosphate synthase subunit HisH n=1 Tax=Alicyclobacillus fastidiosus TaxID=392011 RepID=A0ABY6ZFB6_9BACL|nr:imidazole glycerol phosphate synthase subunit HisH [Alicyclobacillus fastidiosus]WAH40911.1 imidazole glycerol phosphate synthase subunit HisH [Alicyclobacillus fastidiosus]GMA62406.1 imidazole glycerol phosphate synthase subunit HisH [Alicyclobacillus fastidiosus]